MPQKGGPGHEKAMMEYAEELESQGFRIFVCGNKCPDAIAVKDGKVCAVEILRKVRYERKNPIIIKRKGRYTWKLQSGTTLKRKRETYSNYDDVLIHVFKDI